MIFFLKLVFVLLFALSNQTLAEFNYPDNHSTKNTQTTKINNHTLIITQDKQGLFSVSLKNAPLRAVLKQVAEHTELKFFVYPQVNKTYNLSFSNYSEQKLIDKLTQDLNSYRILAKNKQEVNYTKAITLLPQGNINQLDSPDVITAKIFKPKPITAQKAKTQQSGYGSIYQPRPQNEVKPIIEEIYNGIIVSYVADELLIRIKPGKNINEQIRRLDRLVKKYGGVLSQRMHRLKYFVARFELGIDVKLVKDQLTKQDYVTAVEPNYFAKLTTTTQANTNKWHLNTLNITQPATTTIATNTLRPKIAIIDTGVNASVTQLIGKVRPIANTINNTTNTTDDNGHGTTMALLTLQTAPNAIIHAVKVMDSNGVGTYGDIAQGIFHALDRKIQVINISLGGYKPSQILQDAIAYAQYKGVTVVAAVGNDGYQNTPFYPAAYANVIGVGAINANNQVLPNSNQGTMVDLVAPGLNIAYQQNTQTKTTQGTSVAAALISGMVAQVASSPTRQNPAMIAGKLFETAINLLTSGKDNATGYGIANLSLALRLATPAGNYEQAFLVIDEVIPLDGQQLARITDFDKGEITEWLDLNEQFSPSQYNKVCGTNEVSNGTIVTLKDDVSRHSVGLAELDCADSDIFSNDEHFRMYVFSGVVENLKIGDHELLNVITTGDAISNNNAKFNMIDTDTLGLRGNSNYDGYEWIETFDTGVFDEDDFDSRSDFATSIQTYLASQLNAIPSHLLYAEKDYYWDVNTMSLTGSVNNNLGTKTPIIFIHGWNGSEENWADTLLSQNEVQAWWELAEDNSNSVYLDNAKKADSTKNNSHDGYFDLKNLDNDFKVYKFRYPTMRSNEYNAKRLSDLISNHPELGQSSVNNIILVGHSTGGLLAKYAMLGYGVVPSINNKVKKVITLATPHRGSTGGSDYDTISGIDEIVGSLVSGFNLKTDGAIDLAWDGVWSDNNNTLQAVYNTAVVVGNLARFAGPVAAAAGRVLGGISAVGQCTYPALRPQLNTYNFNTKLATLNANLIANSAIYDKFIFYSGWVAPFNNDNNDSQVILSLYLYCDDGLVTDSVVSLPSGLLFSSNETLAQVNALREQAENNSNQYAIDGNRRIFYDRDHSQMREGIFELDGLGGNYNNTGRSNDKLFTQFETDIKAVVSETNTNFDPTIPRNGLVAEYLFNGSANDTAGNNHGTTVGANYINNQLNISSDGDRVEIPHSTSIGLDTSNKSISVIFMFNNLTNTYNEIFDKTNGSAYSLSVQKLSNNSFQLRFNNCSSGCPGSIITYPVVENTLYHVAIVKNNNTTTVYVNGQNIGSMSVSFNENTRSLIVGAGGTPYASGYSFNGIIDNLRFYNRVLTTSEIQALYQENSTPITNTAPNNGLVAEYLFNGNANDTSGNNNHGTVNGAVLTTDRFGNTDSAYLFDGVDDYISISSISTTIVSYITMSAWVNAKPQNTDNYTAGGIVLNGGDYEFAITANTNSIRYALTGVTPVPSWTDTGIDTSLNQWSLISIVYDGTKIITYLNGQQVDSRNFSGSMPGTIGYPFGIGARYLEQGGSVPLNGWYSLFNGKIDDVRIYNRALSASEIQALYQENSTLFSNNIYNEEFNSLESFQTNWTQITHSGCCGAGNPATYTVENGKLILTTNGGSNGSYGISDGSSFSPNNTVLSGNFSVEVSLKELFREKINGYKDNSGIGLYLATQNNISNRIANISIRGNYSGYFEGYAYNQYQGHRVSSWDYAAGRSFFIDEYDLNTLYDLKFKIERVDGNLSVSYKLSSDNNWTKYTTNINNYQDLIPIISISSADGGVTRKNGRFSAEVDYIRVGENEYLGVSVNLNIATTGSGSVISSPNGINCGSDCNQSFYQNANISLTATAASGYQFSHWSGSCSGSGGSTSVVMSNTKQCTAHFIDTTPNILSFNTNSGSELNSAVVQTITISGINTATDISISGGQYAINNGAYSSSTATVNNGDVVSVRLQTAGSYNTQSSAVLTVGGVSSTFYAITRHQDFSPNAFYFNAEAGLAQNSVATSNYITVSGIDSTTTISVSGGFYQIATNTITSVNGTISNGDSVRLILNSPSSANTVATASLNIGGVIGVFNISTTNADTVPNVLVFTLQNSVEPSSTITSSTAMINGINNTANISIIGGRYAVNNGAFTNASGSINPNDVISLQQTASSGFNSSVTTTVVIGGVSSTFTSTTRVQDFSPATFSFISRANAPLGVSLTSNAITISGIDSTTTISVNGGLYQINNAAITNANGVVSLGDNIVLYHLTANNYLAQTTTTLTLGGVGAGFVSTARGININPDDFTFNIIVNATRSISITSNVVTITGLDATASISVAGGLYRLNGQATTNTDGVVTNGTTLSLTAQSSSEFEAFTTVSLTIGNITRDFFVLTLSRDISPDNLVFINQVDVATAQIITTNPVTITGINDTATLTIANGQYNLNSAGWTGSPTVINNGDVVQLRHTSASGLGISITTTLGVGDVSVTFTSTTQPPSTRRIVILSQGSGTITAYPTPTYNNGYYAYGDYEQGTTVTLYANASNDYALSHWHNCPITNGNTCYVPITQDATITAYFTGSNTTPNPFYFYGATNTYPSTYTYSNYITISGLTTSTYINITNGQYRINNNAFTSNNSYGINNGNTIQVRHITSSNYLTNTSTFIDIGGVSTTFTSTTQQTLSSAPVISQPTSITLQNNQMIHLNTGIIPGVDLRTITTDQSTASLQFRIINASEVYSNYRISIGHLNSTSNVFVNRNDNTIHVHPQNNVVGTVDVLIQARDNNNQLSLPSTWTITVVNPPVATYTLTTIASSGTITSNPAGINCGSDCSQTYNAGTAVTLTANPDSGYVFNNWSDSCSGNNNIFNITLNSNLSCQANFSISGTTTLDTDGDGIPNETDTDDDNDGLPDAFETANGLNPLDASDANADLDGDGFSNLEEYQFNTLINDSSSIPLYQTVAVDGGDRNILPNSTVSLSVNYSVSDNDNTLTGLGLRVHFNQANLLFINTTNTLSTGFITANSTPIADSSNFDNDSSTSHYIGIAWSDLGGNWSNQTLPSKLFDINFLPSNNFTVGSSTIINFSVSSLTSGYEFKQQPSLLTLSDLNLDIDGNNNADALTDGLLVIRYLFGFRGNTLINSAIGSNATRDSTTTIENYLSRLQSSNVSDIDGNNNSDALTDGLLIIRYLFGFRNDTLTSSATATGSSRSGSEIEGYLQGISR